MSHGGDGFRSAELAAQASVLCSEVGLAFQQCGRSQPKCGGRAVEHMTSSSSEHFIAADAIVGTDSQPGSKVRLRFPWAHIQSHFTDDRLCDDDIDAIDARQIYSGDALQFIGEMEVWIILVLFLLLFRGQYFLHWRWDGTGKSTQVLLQFLVAFSHPSLLGVIHLDFLLQHEDEFLAPVAL